MGVEAETSLLVKVVTNFASKTSEYVQEIPQTQTTAQTTNIDTKSE